MRYDYDGYGDLTAVYGRDGKKLRGFAYRNHIMVEHNRPDGLVSRYEYDRYDAKTNLPGQVPSRNAPTSSGTEPDYFRSTPTKAATPISTPTKTATNPWPKSSITTKTKSNTSPISTPTTSASRAR